MMDILNDTRALNDAMKRLASPEAKAKAVKVAKAARDADPMQDGFLSIFWQRDDGTGTISDLQARSLETASYSIYRPLQETNIDVTPLRWFAAHPDALVAFADVLEAKYEYYVAVQDAIEELSAKRRAQVAEREQYEAERAKLKTNLPDVVSELQARIAELEAERG